MTSRYGQLLFTPAVREHQERHGSRRNYEHMTAGPARADRLTRDEAGFAATRTSFYLASTSSTGWPYVQHRGGRPASCSLDEKTLAFADYRGTSSTSPRGTSTPTTGWPCCSWTTRPGAG